jgi:hypothetical protein
MPADGMSAAAKRKEFGTPTARQASELLDRLAFRARRSLAFAEQSPGATFRQVWQAAVEG